MSEKQVESQTLPQHFCMCMHKHVRKENRKVNPLKIVHRKEKNGRKRSLVRKLLQLEVGNRSMKNERPVKLHTSKHVW